MVIEIIEKNEIRPFNDFFFYTCFYSSLAPVLVAYEVPIPLVFSNVFYYYEIVNDLITVKFELLQPLDSLLNRAGIEMHQFHGSIDLVQILKEELSKNHPMIVFVDLFYLSYRLDEYGKKHDSHSILIIGYDDVSDNVIVIEHSSRDTLDFKKREIKVSDILIAHNEYVKEIDDFGFVACSLEHKGKCKRVGNNFETCLERELCSKERKKIGLNNLKLFMAKMKAQSGSVNRLEDNIIELSTNIQYILKAVRGERKLLEMNGCKDYGKEITLLEECWVTINNIIQYFAISGRYKEKKLETLIFQLEKIIDIEERRLNKS